jgi:hypothetical protein
MKHSAGAGGPNEAKYSKEGYSLYEMHEILSPKTHRRTQQLTRGFKLIQCSERVHGPFVAVASAENQGIPHELVRWNFKHLKNLA